MQRVRQIALDQQKRVSRMQALLTKANGKLKTLLEAKEERDLKILYMEQDEQKLREKILELEQQNHQYQ